MFDVKTSEDRFFRDICAYLSHQCGQNAAGLSQEARDLVPALASPLAALRSAMLSGDRSLVDLVIDAHESALHAQSRHFCTQEFWDSLSKFDLTHDVMNHLLDRFVELGTEPTRLKERFILLSRRAILMDQPALLAALVAYCAPTDTVISDLLFKTSCLMNSGPKCAAIVLDLIESHPQTAPAWQGFFNEEIRKGHWKSACLALRLGKVQHPSLPGKADAEHARGSNRLPYYLGSKHRLLVLYDFLPEPLEILATPGWKFQQSLNAKLSK